MDKYCEYCMDDERHRRIKLIISIEKDLYETIKDCVEHGQNYDYFEVIANGIPYEERLPFGESASPNMVPIAKVEFSKEQLQEIVRQAIQKYIDSGTVETRACVDCKYYNTDPNEEPCRCCCYGDGLDNFEEREVSDGRNT